MRHRIAHNDRRSTLQASHAPRGVAAYRQPSRQGKGLVHPAVGHLRPLRRVTREQISACLAGAIADKPISTMTNMGGSHEAPRHRAGMLASLEDGNACRDRCLIAIDPL